MAADRVSPVPGPCRAVGFCYTLNDLPHLKREELPVPGATVSGAAPLLKLF